MDPYLIMAGALFTAGWAYLIFSFVSLGLDGRTWVSKSIYFVHLIGVSMGSFGTCFALIQGDKFLGYTTLEWANVLAIALSLLSPFLIAVLVEKLLRERNR